LANDWAAGGADVVARVRATDPSTYLRVVASILPKDVLVNVRQDASILPEDRELLVDLLRTIRNAVPADAPTTPVLEFIGDVLRAEYAKPVEST
jgi:hypothetical protein